MRPFRIDILHILVLMCATLLLVLLASAAFSHEWYDPECCNDYDCQSVPASSVQLTPSGIRLTLGPGDHKFVSEPSSWLVPYTSHKVRKSQDGDVHACVGRVTGVLFCIYLPPMGV